MDTIAFDECRKRRLPPWMLGAAAPDQVANSERGVSDVAISEEKRVVSQCREATSKATRTAQCGSEVRLSSQDISKADSSILLVKCKTKKINIKLSRRDAIPDANVQQIGVEKKKRRAAGRKIQEAAPRRRRRATGSDFGSSEENEVGSSTEDDEDLTMDDLMSIAQKYVKDNSEMGQQQPSNGGNIAESRFASSTFSCNEPGSSAVVPMDRRSPRPKETAPCHGSDGNFISGKIVANSSMTGDPTKDMLDLFLGPLLKNPLDEKKVELITENMAYSHDFREQQQNAVTSDEVVAPTKKKSSLKDMVAMFLD